MELILTDWHWAYLPIIFFAYIIFGLSGFGTTLIAAPWLSLYLPLNHIIPMIVILDAIASFKNWYQSQQHVQYLQVKRLFPFMLVGATIGICLLTYGQPKFLLLCMAIFCIAYSLYQLLKKLHQFKVVRHILRQSLVFLVGYLVRCLAVEVSYTRCFYNEILIKKFRSNPRKVF